MIIFSTLREHTAVTPNVGGVECIMVGDTGPAMFFLFRGGGGGGGGLAPS